MLPTIVNNNNDIYIYIYITFYAFILKGEYIQTQYSLQKISLLPNYTVMI